MATTLARKYRIDVTTDLTLAGGWTELKGVNDWNDSVTPQLEDTSAYDTSGWNTKEVTMNDWSAQATVFRRISGGVYDPGQELVRACRGQFGTAARCGLRWYDKNLGPEAYQGVAIPMWARNNTGVANVEQVQITFNSTDVPLATISNPGVAATAALITGASPSGVGAGGVVSIQGSLFTGTTGAAGVKFGGVNASFYIVQNDNLIAAVMPAGSAGSAPIIVTNPVGASAAFPYTRT